MIMADSTPEPSDLVRAAERGNLEDVEFILKRYPTEVDITCNDMTALHAAASKGHIEIMKALIRCNADLQFCDLDYATPLHYAVRNNQKDAVLILLKCGAKRDEEDNFGVTAPVYAFNNKLKDCIKVFQEYNPAVQFKKEEVNRPRKSPENFEVPEEEAMEDNKKSQLNSEDFSSVEVEPKKDLCVYCFKNEACIMFEPCRCVVSCFECFLSVHACKCGEVIEKRSCDESKQVRRCIKKMKDLKRKHELLTTEHKLLTTEHRLLTTRNQQKERRIEELTCHTTCGICTYRALRCVLNCGHMYCVPCVKRLKKNVKRNDPVCATCGRSSRYTVLHPEWPTPYIPDERD